MRSLLLLFTTFVMLAVCGLELKAQSLPRVGEAIVVSRLRASRAPTVRAGDRTITIVRVDPSRYRFRLFTESHDGSRRPLPRWIGDENLTGGINAGMFLPDGRTVGFSMVDGVVRSNRRPAMFTAVVGLDPVTAASSRLAMGGEGCAVDLDGLRRTHRSVLQVRKLLLSCQGEPLSWPNRRRYSAAAFGIDEHGHAVLVHCRTPYRMDELSEMLHDLDPGLRALAFMEGGPEASLIVRGGSVNVAEVGSYEDGFNENDDNRAFWDLPNIIGFAPRDL